MTSPLMRVSRPLVWKGTTPRQLLAAVGKRLAPAPRQCAIHGSLGSVQARCRIPRLSTTRRQRVATVASIWLPPTSTRQPPGFRSGLRVSGGRHGQLIAKVGSHQGGILGIADRSSHAGGATVPALRAPRQAWLRDGRKSPAAPPGGRSPRPAPIVHRRPAGRVSVSACSRLSTARCETDALPPAPPPGRPRSRPGGLRRRLVGVLPPTRRRRVPSAPPRAPVASAAGGGAWSKLASSQRSQARLAVHTI